MKICYLKFNRVVFFLSLVLATYCPAAYAIVVIKPKGQDAIPMRAKTLEANVVINRQFATTRLSMTFQNETSNRIEADFLYTVPPRTTVTYFAYWYEGEKVVARVVEKERAAAIYQHITTRMRDPALIELVGKNTFRARIFPIEPDADLRIEMHFVQYLPADDGGASYTFPLAPEEAGKGTLEKLDINTRIVPDATLRGVTNNYRQPVSRDASGNYNIRLRQLNYRAPRDFVVRLQRARPALRALVYAARSGGSDGFFALALTANKSLQKPTLRLAGVTTYDIVPSRLPSVKAGQTVLVCGRYKGSGSATVKLAGSGDGRRMELSQRVAFSSSREDNNLATKLWAARRIEELSVNSKNRAKVVALSTRFTLPSKWTSWLAVPEAELERFKQEKMQADREIVARRYAQEVAAGRRNGRTARALKARFTSLSNQLEYDSTTLSDYLTPAVVDLSEALFNERYSKKPNVHRVKSLQIQIKRLLLAGANNGKYPSELLQREMSQVSRQLVGEEMNGRPQSQYAKQMRSTLKNLSRKGQDYGWGWKEIYEREKQQRIDNLTSAYVNNAYAKRGKRNVAELAHRQLVTFLGKKTAEQQIAKARDTWIEWKLIELTPQIIDEKYAVNPNAARLAELKTEVARLEKLGDTTLENEASWRIGPALRESMAKAREEYIHELSKDRPDPAVLKAHENRILRIYRDPEYVVRTPDYGEPVYENTSPLNHPKIEEMRSKILDLDEQLAREPSKVEREIIRFMRESTIKKVDYATRYHLRLGDPLIAVEASEDATQVVALMPDGAVKRLVWNSGSRKWEGRFDIPSYAAEGAYVITVIVVEKNGLRRSMELRYRVDMTAPQGEGAARLTNDDKRVLRLEIKADSGIARVSALLPWGERIELSPSNTQENNFFGLADVPISHVGKKGRITYVLTDKAHNRREIVVDLSK